MKKLILLVFSMIAVGQASSEVPGDVPRDTVVHSKTIGSPEQALARALEITGFEKWMTIPVSPAEELVSKVIVYDDVTPFLADKINGRELWSVRLDSVDIRPDVARSRGDNRWALKSFEILLDPSTGQVLRIHSGHADEKDNVFPEPRPEQAEVELRSGGEIYHGFPKSDPEVNFFDAVRAAVGCAPLSAKEIIAQYILYSRDGQPPKPVWCITCRGVKPVKFTSLGGGSTRERCVVDAVTGHWLFMTNSPVALPENGEEQ